MATVTYAWLQTLPSYQMNQFTPGNQADPAIGVTSNGYIGGWTDPTTPGSKTRLAGPSGPSEGSGGAGPAEEPSFARLTDGRMLHAFTALHADPGGDISVHVVGGLSVLFDVNTSGLDDSDSDIAALPDGGFVVTWTRHFGNNDNDIIGAVLNADGTFRAGGPHTGFGIGISSNASAINSRISSVAALASGGFVVVWEELPAAGGDSDVYFRRYAAAGTPVDLAPVPIDTSGSTNRDIQVVGLPDGGFAVAYVDRSDLAFFGDDITLRIYNGDGSFRTENGIYAPGSQHAPSLTVLDNGFIVVGWTDGGVLRPQVFDTTANPIGPEGFGWGATVEAEIANLGNGLVANVRSSTISDGDGHSIRSSIDQFFRTSVGDGTSETLTGDALPDEMTGNGGNDRLIGGGGIDIANYNGPRSNYLLHTTISGGVTTTLVRDGAGSDGADTLTDFETLQFTSGAITPPGPQFNLVANVDGQRFDDVVYRKVSNGQVVFQNMTNGVAVGFDAITSPLTSAWKAIGAGDVTADGKADVFIWNSSTGQVFSASPGASGAPIFAVVATGITGNFAAVGVGDLDGDGFTDLLVRDGSNGAISWRPMTEGSPDAFKPVGTFGPTWTYQGTGDVNRDGFADVAIRSSAGQVVLVNMANGAPSGFIDLGNVSGFRVGAIADVNGDGFDDVVLQNEANGQAVWRNLSGAGPGPTWNIATDPMGTEWVLRRGADVDHDGSADLIFQHTTTGQTIYRAMDAGVGTGWGTVSNSLGGEFLVV